MTTRFPQRQMPMASAALSLPTIGAAAFIPKQPPLFSSSSSSSTKTTRPTKIHTRLGGGDGDVKRAEKKKFITKEEEPEQYWQTAGEREGENPMKTPLPYIIIFGMSTPFVILAIAFANGWIKVPVR